MRRKYLSMVKEIILIRTLRKLLRVAKRRKRYKEILKGIPVYLKTKVVGTREKGIYVKGCFFYYGKNKRIELYLGSIKECCGHKDKITIGLDLLQVLFHEIHHVRQYHSRKSFWDYHNNAKRGKFEGLAEVWSRKEIEKFCHTLT